MSKIVDPKVLERNARERFGCSLAEALAANNGLPLNQRGSMAAAYYQQRNSAKGRGVAWAFNFIEWCRVWNESGKWPMRGVGRAGYCMARHGDTGPYSTENVSICPSPVNSADGLSKARSNPHFGANQKNRTGTGRGWTLRGGRHHKKPYQVVVADKYIGSFATQSQAEAAYEEASERHLAEVQKQKQLISKHACSLPLTPKEVTANKFTNLAWSHK